MTDFRHANNVCYMQQQNQQQQQQPTAIPRETFGTTTTPENFQVSSTKDQQQQQQQLRLQQQQQQNPLLQSLIDYTHNLTTPSTVTAIGRNYNASNGTLDRDSSMNVNVNVNGIQFDEHEIYYVSPTKRKGNLRNTVVGAALPMRHSQYQAQYAQQPQIQQHPQPQQQTRFALASPLRNAVTTSKASYGSRLAGVVHDFSLDETGSSHYSDTAMQVLRSGSMSGSILGAANHTHLQQQQYNNNFQSHSSSSSSLATVNGHFYNNNSSNNNNNVVTFAQTSNQGSLQRNKGRSSQSLCSCDVGADTELNLQSTRPLYQYDLEGKRMHTYTCEQNAQILMRLERERQRKLSLGADIGLSVSFGSSNTPTKSRAKNENQKLPFYATDLDNIPPVPPPPTLKHHASKLGLQFMQQEQRTIDRNSNSRNSMLDTLCSNDVGSLLDDCTASILKCANTIGNEMGLPTNINASATGKTLAYDNQQIGKPPANKYSMQSRCSQGDVFMPESKKTADLSLCFLHAKNNKLGSEIMEPTQLLRNSLKKYNTIGPSSMEYGKQLSYYREQRGLDGRNRCRCVSKSLSSFPHTHFDNEHLDGYEGHVESITKYNTPIISNSFSNLVSNADIRCTTARSNRFYIPIASSLPNESSFVTLNDSSTNSGLNHHQHQQHHSHHQHNHNDYLLHNTNTMELRNQLVSLQQQQQQQQQQPIQHQQQHNHEQQKHQHLQSHETNMMPWKHRQCPSRCSSSSGNSSLRFDAAKHWFAVSSILLIIGAASVAVPLALRVAASAPFEERLRVAQQLLDQVPLIDGHNDLPWNIRKFLHNKLNDFNFDQDLRSVMPWARSHWSHTDLQRLKKGRVSAQFWAAYVPCEAQHRDAVQLTLEQIDVIKRLTDRYAPQLIACTSSEDIIEAHKKHQMCSLTGVEGGHSLGGSLAVLRTLYAIGVRYMTLTSTCHTPWADSSYADAPTFNVKHGGLTIFGKTIIREMNRLGMMVDLSHVSTGTMRDALEVSEAPIIFSHSSAYELCNSSRNVQDDTLQSLAKNGGIVMVNFYSRFLSCNENATVHDAVAHINHIRRVAGVDHVGLGAGFDGINFTPKGLEDVSTYPTLFAELVGVGWTVEDLTKLAGGNFLRVMQRVEKLRDEKRSLGIKPYEDHPNFRNDDPYNCTSS